MDLKALLHNDCNVSALHVLGQAKSRGSTFKWLTTNEVRKIKGYRGAEHSRHPTFEHDLMENTQYE